MVSLTVDGAVRAKVATGAEVTFQAIAEVPRGTGEIVSVEWDFDGAGVFPVREPVPVSERTVVAHRHSFAAPGTYFPSVRVAAHRDGDTATPYARIQNLARVRVVVGDP